MLDPARRAAEADIEDTLRFLEGFSVWSARTVISCISDPQDMIFEIQNSSMSDATKVWCRDTRIAHLKKKGYVKKLPRNKPKNTARDNIFRAAADQLVQCGYNPTRDASKAEKHSAASIIREALKRQTKSKKVLSEKRIEEIILTKP